MGYLKSLKIDIENTDKRIKITWKTMDEVINVTFFKETDTFPQYFQT